MLGAGLWTGAGGAAQKIVLIGEIFGVVLAEPFGAEIREKHPAMHGDVSAGDVGGVVRLTEMVELLFVGARSGHPALVTAIFDGDNLEMGGLAGVADLKDVHATMTVVPVIAEATLETVEAVTVIDVEDMQKIVSGAVVDWLSEVDGRRVVVAAHRDAARDEQSLVTVVLVVGQEQEAELVREDFVIGIVGLDFC